MIFSSRKRRKDRIAARFMGQVHAEIAHAAIEAKSEKGLTQRDVAAALGVDKSVISRILRGTGNPTIRTIGELSAALGYRPELLLHKADPGPYGNTPHVEVVGAALHPRNAGTSARPSSVSVQVQGLSQTERGTAAHSPQVAS